MLTINQIKIANALLKGVNDNNSLEYEISEANNSDVWTVKTVLATELKLIGYSEEIINETIPPYDKPYLTDEGRKAFKMGMRKYINRLSEIDKMEHKKLKFDVRNGKWALMLSIASLLLVVLSIVISLFALFKHC